MGCETPETSAGFPQFPLSHTVAPRSKEGWDSEPSQSQLTETHHGPSEPAELPKSRFLARQGDLGAAETSPTAAGHRPWFCPNGPP